MIVRMQVRRGTSTQWTNANPILSNGEFGYETDTETIKIGNGTDAWNDLGYLQGSGGGGIDGEDGASAYEIAVANGFIGTEVEWLDSLRPIRYMDGNIFSGEGEIEIDPVTIQNGGITEVKLSGDVITKLNSGGSATTDASELTTGTLPSERIGDGSIDEIKLDTSVNASLDLADSSSQPGHTHTSSNITDFDIEVGNNTDVASNTSHRSLTNNPHSVTKSQVGLSNVDDVSAINLRDRSTHTGTQAAITISDFDIEVSNNSDVTANTAKVTNATHTGDVTGSTSLTIADGVVTETKLHSDVQNKLNLNIVSERESNTVLFDQDYVIGNAAARTGNVLFDFTGAKLGSSTMMIHTDASPFTLPGIVLSGTISDTVANYIYFLITDITASSEKVHVTISQEQV